MEAMGGPTDYKRAIELSELGARKGDGFAFGLLGSM